MAHRILLWKLQKYGIPTPWFKSYLSERYQYVEIDGETSTKQEITCGVPQGSILGPLLFILYINDLPKATNAQTLLYADDSTFLTTADNNESLINATNEQLRNISQWFKDNALTVHPAKTQFMTFLTKNGKDFNGKITLEETNIERIGTEEQVKSTKFVGIHIDEKLKWDHHIAAIHKKLKSNAFLINSNKNILPEKIRLLLYNALIKPHLEYGCTIWGFGNIKSLVTKQKQIIRSVANAKNWRGHTNQHFAKFKLHKLQDLISINTLNFAYANINQLTPVTLDDIVNLRQARNTRQGELTMAEEPPITTKALERSLLYKAPREWNSLDENIKQRSPSDFKKTVKELYIIKYQNERKCDIPNCYSCKDIVPPR